MLNLPANARLFLCRQPVRMHKSFEGLSEIVEELFPGERFSGAFFIFLNRTRDCMKILFWDGDGFVIWYKRLQKGTFKAKEEIVHLDRRTFFMLLEGVIPQKIRPRFSL